MQSKSLRLCILGGAMLICCLLAGCSLLSIKRTSLAPSRRYPTGRPSGQLARMAQTMWRYFAWCLPIQRTAGSACMTHLRDKPSQPLMVAPPGLRRRPLTA